jgi:arsenate reductase
MQKLELFGIPNCDTVKKARLWLEENNLSYTFHDFKKEGVSLEQLKKWTDTIGLENILNKRGTTWRKLSEAIKDTLTFEKALVLMQEQPSLIKRPILQANHITLSGFSPAQWQALL